MRADKRIRAPTVSILCIPSYHYEPYSDVSVRAGEPISIKKKHRKSNCNHMREVEQQRGLSSTTFGRTGEPEELGFSLRSRGSLVSAYPQMDLATGKRFYNKAAEKGSNTANQQRGAAHSKKLESEEAGLDEHARKTLLRLQTIWRLSSRDDTNKVEGLWRLLGDINLWIAAYKKLAPNPGSMTKGGAGGTIDGTSLKTLRALRDSILEGTFRWGITRRTFIPKFAPRCFATPLAPKGGLRPLGIPEFQDRLTQEVLRTLIETVFEPRFTELSHGFRPGRSQHTCLRQIRRDFRGVNWYIEGDISKCFDKIDHDKLIEALGKAIDGKQFLAFIKQGLKNKVLLPEGKIETNLVGTPQGGICSPILSNIMLHELDKFIIRLQKIINRGARRKQNPVYSKIHDKRRKFLRLGLRKEAHLALKQAPYFLERNKCFARKVSYSAYDDPTFRRVVYTRFADDFIIGISGPKKLAIRVRELVAKFLRIRLKLQLNIDKTLISRAKTSKIGFLGYLINLAPQHGYINKRRYKGPHSLMRKVKVVRAGNLRLLVDTRKIICRLADKGFCSKNGDPKPNFQYLQDPQSFTNSRMASLINGLNQYYKLADNRRSAISYISFVIRHSIAKMYAAKFKLKTRAQVFARAGKDLSKPLEAKKGANQSVGATDKQLKEWAEKAGGKLEGSIPAIPYSKYKDIPKPDTKPLQKDWTPKDREDGTMPDPLRKLNWRSLRGRTALTGVCARCGANDNVEMHHVRKLKDLVTS
uniref:Reverse transcriptase domain-containing protein n=1 Tax=Coleochaete scutata TaxID=3125 RepID=A0A5P9NVY2_COLSC|nr:hypothetical protein [Coleochaete scutata]QFU80120.1 hypothetical protein [Coleochaete scutata]